MKIAMINIAKKFEEGWPDYYATDGRNTHDTHATRIYMHVPHTRTTHHTPHNARVARSN
jgi:hypothetical protein